MVKQTSLRMFAPRSAPEPSATVDTLVLAAWELLLEAAQHTDLEAVLGAADEAATPGSPDHRRALRRRLLVQVPAPAPQLSPALTRRETEVLSELSLGGSYADIARALYITENTVKTHLGAVYRKLGVSNRSQALRVGRARGLVG